MTLSELSRAALRSLLLAAPLVVLAWPSPARALERTFKATEDTWVSQATTSTNYGTDKTMRFGRDANGDNQYAYVKFDVSSLVDVIVEWVRLEFYVTALANPNGIEHRIRETTDFWQELTLTDKNRPATGVTIEDNHNEITATGPWIQYSNEKGDNTSLHGAVQDWIDRTGRNEGLRLGVANSQNTQFVDLATREHSTPSFQPRLVVQYRPAFPADLRPVVTGLSDSLVVVNQSFTLVSGPKRVE